MNVEYVYRGLRFLLVIAVIVAFSLALFYISKIMYPFIFALIIAFMMNPLVNTLEKKAKMPRGLSVLVSLTFIISFIAALLTFLVAEVISGTTYLAKVVPEHFQKLVDYLEQFFVSQIIPFYEQLAHYFHTLNIGQQKTIMDNIKNIGGQIGTTVGDAIQSILNSIPSLLAGLPNLASGFIFTLLATFFISKDWYSLGHHLKKYLPTKVATSGGHVFRELKKALFGFVKAQLTLISMTAAIVLVGLLIMRVNYAITIALIIGLVDLLPYLGTGTVFVPWIFYTFFAGNYPFAIGLSVLYILVILQRQVAEPKILSSNIGLDPLATLISLFVGFKLFGVLGLIIGPTSLVILKTLHDAHVFTDIWLFIKGKQPN